MHAWQGTNVGQGHERIQRAGQERDTSGHLLFIGFRWRGSLIHGERLAGLTAQGPRTVFSRAVVVKVFQTNYKRGNEFLHKLIKFAMCIGRKNCPTYVMVTFAPASGAHARGDCQGK